MSIEMITTKLTGASGAACPKAALQLQPQSQWLQSETYVPAPARSADVEAHGRLRRHSGIGVSEGFGSGNTPMVRGNRGNRPWRERT